MSELGLEATLRELGIAEYIDLTRETTLARAIARAYTGDAQQPNPRRLPRLGFLYESQGIAAYQSRVAGRSDSAPEDVRSHFEVAFACWRALLSLPDELVHFTLYDEGASSLGVSLVAEEMGDEPISSDLTLAFRVAVTGLLGQRNAEVRLELKQFSLRPTEQLESWRDLVADHVFTAFTLLVRKGGGWQDIDQALSSIGELRRLQERHEESYLESRGDTTEQTIAAVELVGLYHLAQMVTSTGEYLQDGQVTITQLNSQLDRHRERAENAFVTGRRTLLGHLANLLWVGCRQLANDAIWTHIGGLGESAQQFARLLVGRGRPRPVIELWPSQQEAFRQSLLDPYRRAILVEMPTSAGKTLLAKFAIVQTKALNPSGTVAYVVPTRALVNQVTLDLRADYRELKPRISVEQTVSAFELDPTEEHLLNSAPGVLVTTPEKLDLLVRRDHPVTRDLTLVIADEAHNIGDQSRGARLELLLGTIKRDRIGARFLLLSPFMPNNDEIVRWLGDDRALPPISVDWKPARRVVGVVSTRGRRSQRQLLFQTLPAADNADIRRNLDIPIEVGENVVGSGTTVENLSLLTVRALRERGSILILCRGRGTAVERARSIAQDLPEVEPSPLLKAVCRYLRAEVGRDTSLIRCLRRGVAYHHSGLSQEARWLIESLIRRGEISVVCGTTTLAQGINFPIATVIVETLWKGDVYLTYQDFWNIAGRAGRALMDTLGVVAFPASSEERRQAFTEFLEGEAEEISSQLAALIDRADEIAESLNLDTLRDLPQLSSLLQFLSHAMRVSGGGDIADEIDDLLRASLVYHQAQRQSEVAAQRLVDLCRAYLQQIRGEPGLLALADQTGFATPSVLELLNQKRDSPELADLADWQPDVLFSDDTSPLRQRIQAIADLPEMQLGQGSGPPFNAERVAQILSGWVNGETLDSLAQKYLLADETDPEARVAEFSRYLFSTLLGRVSWGIGALESVCLTGTDEAQRENAGYVPSMIFFGVQRKEAIWLRMVGVPRMVADNLGQLWQQSRSDEPDTYEGIREWIGQLRDEDWQQAIPAGAPLMPQDMRLIWKELAGG